MVSTNQRVLVELNALKIQVTSFWCCFLEEDLCELGQNHWGLDLPLRVTNSNRCIAQAIKTPLARGGVIDSPPHQSCSRKALSAGIIPALHTFLGAEPDTPAVSSPTYWGAVTCVTFDQERSTGQQGLLVVGAPPPHRHLAPVESGLCSP